MFVSVLSAQIVAFCVTINSQTNIVDVFSVTLYVFMTIYVLLLIWFTGSVSL